MSWKKRRKVRLEKIEHKTIENIVEVEKAYRRHKTFCKSHDTTPLTKEVFVADYMKHQEPKIQAIKAIIAKFNDKKCPIVNVDCLEFRRLFSLRSSYIDTEKFSNELSKEEWELFYNHQCESCVRYTVLHEFDSPIDMELKEEITQKEFEKGIDGFFEATKPKGDSLEEFENRKGLRPIPQELMKHLSSEYSKTQK
jgi:hypothetical protein